ncbi:long-chain-fatty-acid--CoA ligase [Pseudonocardia sp. H11422]|uniref:long-chain-fatty-acid--CoA ligase n=1 Tax=Pseudonocardia sp. H11422 TaxID=2835866 RepID=UPI001BDCEE22|nr:long-chain-fatty-acid--CoA ligase [Pseudonocardia sp. H11422]
MQATQMLRHAARINPAGDATVCGDRRHTWRETEDRVARFAGALRSLGVRTGDRVAALAMNSDRFFELYYAIPWAGAVFAPLNIRWATEENAFALRAAKVTVLLVDDEFLEQARALQKLVPEISTLIHLGDGPTPLGTVSYEELVAMHEPVPDADRRGDDTYVVFYTSGTTAQSKGVALSHRNAVSVSVCFHATLPTTRDLRFLHVGGMFHLAGAGPTWYITLAAGTHVILPKFEPLAFLVGIAEHRITNSVLVPTMINMLLHQPELGEHDLSSWHTCVYGGSPMPEAVLRRALELIPGCRFHQIYGMTETAGYATALTWQDHLDGLTREDGTLRSAGRAIPGMDIRTLRPDGTEAGVGEVGEIVLRGDNVMTGYFDNPDADAEVLRDGWLRSGDAGFFDERGYLHVADRVKDMIISGAENVYSADVERALYDHPAVRECAVIGIPSERWGEAVHAVVVLKDGAEATEEELIVHCRGLIGGYKCPRSVEFRTEPLPTTPVGKIRKNVLREPHWRGRETRI